MFEMPLMFFEEGEGFITLPALKKFTKDIGKKEFRTTEDRATLLKNIEKFANESSTNEEMVLNWIDSILKEGIKEVHVKLLNISLEKKAFLENYKCVNKILADNIYDNNKKHLYNNYTADIRLFRYDITDSIHGRVITLYMGKLLCMFDKKEKTSRTIMYPIVADIYPSQDIVAVRAKSKADLYKFMEEFAIDAATRAYVDKEIEQAFIFISNLFSFEFKKPIEASTEFKRRLFMLLDRFTKTPECILQMIQEKKEDIEKIKQLIVNDICKLSISKYGKDVEADVSNMIEKYFSISYPDKKIFTRERDAYPLKLLASDDEESKVEQTAGLAEPLQSKAIFFDNKKMLQKSRKCEGVKFVFRRLNTLYTSKDFIVNIVIQKNYCALKFTEYTMEEDILNVLFSFIAAEDNVERTANPAIE